MDGTSPADLAALAALGEPTRWQLYDHVARSPRPVSRDDVASALGLARTNVAFHLDRLVEEGLLAVDYERRTGRTGPGAGRPAKVYRRSGRQISVTLPERRYVLAAQLLAGAVEAAGGRGGSPREELDRQAYETGRRLAATGDRSGGERRALLQVLETYGFEPHETGGAVLLPNCPFHAVAREHTELVCGMNQRLVAGMVAGLDVDGLRATLQPTEGYCCVRLTPVN